MLSVRCGRCCAVAAILVAWQLLSAPGEQGQYGSRSFASWRPGPVHQRSASLCGRGPRASPLQHGRCTSASPASRGSLHLGIVDKLHHTLGEGHSEWRVQFAELLEGHQVVGFVVVFIVIDLFLTACVYVAEETKLLNPALKEQTDRFVELSKQISLTILNIFMLEQLFHVVAFGLSYFRKPWFVLDLVLVSGSLLIELREMREEKRHSKEGRKKSSKTKTCARLLMALRLWKFVAFAFDILLARHLSTSMDTSQAYIRHLEAELLRRRIPLPDI